MSYSQLTPISQNKKTNKPDNTDCFMGAIGGEITYFSEIIGFGYILG
jgi:hypothetical protein